MMISLVFSADTNRGAAANRNAQNGEYARQWPVEQCGDFFNTPARYEWNGIALVEYDGWQTEQDAALLAAAQEAVKASILARENEESWKPIEYPEMSGIWHKATDAIARTTKRFRDLADDDVFPLNGGFWRDANGNPVPMTLSGLMGLEDALFDRAAHNDGVAQYHIGMMMQADNPLEYDYSQGWQ